MESVSTKAEFVTAEKAREYLDRNLCNRPISPQHVDMLARAMCEGKFRYTHQGIAFDSHGTLIDGQHRLTAIAKSGCPQWLQVTRGLENAAKMMIDIQGRPRSVSDALRVSGDQSINRSMVAAVRLWMCLAGEGRKLALHELEAFIEEHRESLKFAHDVCSLGDMTRHSVIQAIVAMAYEAGARHDAEQWAELMRTGMSTEAWHSSVIRLRDWAIAHRRGLNSHSGKLEYIHKAYSSIQAFIERRPLDRTYRAKDIKWVSKS